MSLDTPHVCYGGTFDPFHNGHLAIARAVAEALSAPVSLLPSADPPHRHAPGASAQERALMLELAIAFEPQLGVDRRELRRSGRSYSIDTLLELRSELGPRRPLVWVIGGDSLLQLDTWKDWRQLFALAHVLAVPRPGLDLSATAIAVQAPDVWSEIQRRASQPGDFRGRPSGLFALLPLQPLRTESATEVRRRIHAGEAWQVLVPAAVAGRIRQLGLYGAARAGTVGMDEGQGV